MVTLTNGKRSKTQKTISEKSKDLVKEAEASDTSSSQDSDKENETEEPQPQESFADRLKILKINETPHQSTNPTQLRIPVNSLAQTLIQALNSSDHQLLETCLIQSNKQLIANTIQRIPTALVHNLIEHLILGLNKKRGGAGEGSAVSSVRRTRTLIEWVRQLLLVHMSYLITIPALVSKLTLLHSSLQKRLNLHSKLLSLNGRLDLILNQIERNKSGNPQLELNNEAFNNIRISKPHQIKAKQKAVKPPVKYVEGESTDEEDDEEAMETKKSLDGSDGSDDDSDDDGSIEDVVLGSESGSDDEDGSSDEDDLPQRKGRGKVSVSEGLFDLEAELSGSEEDEDEDDEDEEDEEMADFIDDGSGDESDESD